MTSIWPKFKVGLLVAMVYTVYLLIQSVRAFRAMMAAGTGRESES